MATTSILYLDVDDEITSAAARIRDSEARRVAIVLPYGSRVATSRINFRLLAREASALQRDLVVVAPEPATRVLAISAGLAAHPTVMAFEAAAAEGSPGAGGALGGEGSSGADGVPPNVAADVSPRGAAATSVANSAPAGQVGGSIRSGRPIRAGDDDSHDDE